MPRLEQGENLRGLPARDKVQVYSKMPPSDFISVVVTTYNRSDALAAVVHGLNQQSDRNFEIVVADDGSTEAHQAVVRDVLQASALPAAHVWHPDIGFTASCVRNRGAGEARGAYLIFLDGDCVPEQDFIARHRALRAQGCFVNGSRVMLSPAMTQDVIAGRVEISGRSGGFWLGQRLRGRASKATGRIRLPAQLSLRRQPAFIWKGIRSCNMGVWRSDFETVNGFDESFVGWGHEDADFVLRLHNAGLCRINGFGATEVYHLWHRESSRSAESVNAARVRERMATQQVLPTFGYRQSQGGSDVRVSRWR